MRLGLFSFRLLNTKFAFLILLFSLLCLYLIFPNAINHISKVSASTCYNTYRLKGYVFKDLNSNGVFESGSDEVLNSEQDIVTLEGVSRDWGPVTLSTYSAGSFNFGGLRQGTYLLTGRDDDGWSAYEQTVSIGEGCPATDYIYWHDLPYYEEGINPSNNELVDFSTSLNLYDINGDNTPNDQSWYPTNPGEGKTSFKPVAFIPRDYLAQMGVPDLSDQNISTFIYNQITGALSEYENAVSGSSFTVHSSRVIHSNLSLNEITCGSNQPCQNPNWDALPSRALVEYGSAGSETPVFFLFGGGGIASGHPPEMFIGDCGWDELLGYNLPPDECHTVDGVQRYLYTIRHELGHTIDIPWHSPEYTSYPNISIMSGSPTSVSLADHSGYPEKRIVCESSLNTGSHNCDQFAAPHRPSLLLNSLAGNVHVEGCLEYDTNYSVGLYGSSQGNLYSPFNLLTQSSINSDGSFNINTSSTDIRAWQSGYSIISSRNLLAEIPSVDYYHFNPSGYTYCSSDGSGSNCSNSYDIEVSVADEACISMAEPNLYANVSGTISCGSGTTQNPNMQNGLASAQVTGTHVTTSRYYTNTESRYNFNFSYPGYGPYYTHTMRFRQYYPGTSTVYMTQDVPFYFNDTGLPVINGVVTYPNQFHHHFSTCAATSPTNTPMPTPTPTNTPQSPGPIRGSITCQVDPGHMDGQTMTMYRDGNYYATSNEVSYVSGYVGAYDFSSSLSPSIFSDGSVYAIRPTNNSSTSCNNMWFCPNNGGTYECIRQLGNTIWTKINSTNCFDAWDPDSWVECNGDRSIVNCWMPVEPNLFNFTAVDCSPGGAPVPTSTTTPAPTPTERCWVALQTQLNGTISIIEAPNGVNNDGFCIGGLNEAYVSYYESESEGLSDIYNSAYYPCQDASYVGNTCTVSGQTGHEICTGGPQYEYRRCLRADNRAVNTIDIYLIHPDSANIENTSWDATSIYFGSSQGSIIPNSNVYVELSDNGGSLNGIAGCNYYWTNYTFDVDQRHISIANISKTNYVCSNELMQQEQNFLDALEAASHYEVHNDGDTLVLTGDDLSVLVGFTAQ